MRLLKGLEKTMSQVGSSMGADLVIGHVSAKIPPEVLKVASYRLQQRHPLLRASILKNSNNQPYFHINAANPDAVTFRYYSEPEARKMTRPYHDHPWQSIAESDVDETFDTTSGYMLRVTWIDGNNNDGHLIISAHHAIADGTSLMRMLDQVLSDSDRMMDNTAIPGIQNSADTNCTPEEVTEMPVTPAMLDGLAFDIKDRLFSRAGKWLAVHDARKFNKSPWLPLCPTSESEPEIATRTQSVFAQGSQDNWQKIKKLCKHHGVTVGGLFSAAVEFSILSYLVETGNLTPNAINGLRLPLSMDYNMRTRLDLLEDNPDSIGLYTSIADVGVKISQNIDIWKLAGLISQSAKDKATSKEPHYFQKIVDGIDDVLGFLGKRGIDFHKTSGAMEGVNISNVGRYPHCQTFSGFNLRNIYGMNGACISGPSFIFWLRHIDGHLCYNAIASHPAISRDQLHTVFDRVVCLIEKSILKNESRPFTLTEYLQENSRDAA